MIAAPPLLAGGVKVTLACVLPAVAVPIVGAPGAVVAGAGVTLFDAADAAPVPALLLAFTVNVYAVPLLRPVMVWERPVLPALESIPPAGLEVTV